MNRPRKRQRHVDRRKEPPTVLTRSDKWKLLGMGVGAIGAVFAGYYLHRAKDDFDFQQEFHLQPPQMEKVAEFRKEHEHAYQLLKDHAEQARKNAEAALRSEGETPSAALILVNQANALREQCWQEEMRYSRAVGSLMKPDDASRYLGPREARYKERHPDRRGFIPLPHS